MSILLLVFPQLFFDVARSQPAKPAQKQNLTRNNRSRSFKVTYFGITEKPTTDCISPYNNAGLTSKVSEKQPSKTLKIAVLDNPSRLTPPPRGTSANIRIHLIRQKLESFLLLIAWVSLHSNFCGGLRKMHLFCNRLRLGRSRSSKVVDFGTNRKDICDFLLVINSNFSHIVHRF